MKNKKLKDLKEGDRIWFYNFTYTTQIYVKSAKREGSLMRLEILWDGEEYECFGHSLGYTCVGYCKRFREDVIFTSSYDISLKNEKKTSRIKGIVPVLEKLIEKIEKI